MTGFLGSCSESRQHAKELNNNSEIAAIQARVRLSGKLHDMKSPAIPTET